MIALDTSALIAIVANEPEAEAFATIVAENDCLIGAPTQFEAAMVANRETSGDLYRDLLKILSWKNVAIVDFSAAHAAVAYRAFRDFGRRRGHPAALNYGDCMAYAVASIASAPLLFKGDDFVHTDIPAVWRA
ncbi:MAG TPA: type II toxin-antitoxin system VapC family toxin [Roseiarcus sp.]|nr:type II toxin-antitoxin system VapC family toxin [Roseiarcus sp.]